MTLARWIGAVEPRERWIRRAAWTVLALGLLSFLVRGADRPADPHVVSAGRRPLPGFEEVAFRLTRTDGTTLDWCALLAATESARQHGLMDQDDLRGYDAMLFRFDTPSTAAFYMYRTLLPLSIAWFDGRGAFVSGTDMDPCTDKDPKRCPVYPAARPYRLALETTQGGLGRLGVDADATLTVPGGACP